MRTTNEVYINAARKVKEVFENNRELIMRKKDEYLRGGSENVSEDFKKEYGYVALENLSDQEKLQKIVWRNRDRNNLFFKLEAGEYQNLGSLFMGQTGTFIYPVRFNLDNNTYNVGGPESKGEVHSEEEALEEINNFIAGLKEADGLIKKLNNDSTKKDYHEIYNAVMNKTNNNYLRLALNKYFSLIYPKKWTKFIGKQYGITAVYKLLGIKPKDYADTQYHLMKIQSILLSNNEMSPYEFMLTYDELKQQNIEVEAADKVTQPFTVLDMQVAWYGSLNFYGSMNSGASAIRLKNAKLAKQIMKQYK